MPFTVKIILGEHVNLNQQRRLYLQAIIDRKAARVPFDFYIEEKYFDGRSNRIKGSHPNADDYNTEIMMAITKANGIASRFRIKKLTLTPTLFRAEFKTPTEEIDIIGFIKKELALRAPTFQINTIKQHTTLINKLQSFRKRIAWGELTPELLQQFKNTMIKQGNMDSSIDKILKILKQYLTDARKKGIEFADPFTLIRIRSYISNRTALTEEEVKRLDALYESTDMPNLKKLLRYFLFSCYTGLRISDVSRITWANIHDDMLIYVPYKTKKKNNEVRVPLTREKKYLPAFTHGNKPVFNTYSDPVSNRYLKLAASKAGIKKNITYHTARHTFASLMAETGHLPETQKMMGHGNIKTTMEYVHTSSKNLIDAKNKRFSPME